MFALLLSLQLSFGKTTFDTQEEDVTQLASQAVMLDRVGSLLRGSHWRPTDALRLEAISLQEGFELLQQSEILSTSLNHSN